MRRELSTLAERTFDLLIIGGGIHGAVAAWDAALRGLDVALVERGDFGAATSANTLKIVHGGLRYLQTANLRRMRESIGERSTLMRIAPYLVRPLPFLVATRGAGKHGRAAMGVALGLNDAISFDRNRGVAPEARIPGGRLVSRRSCVELFPAFDGLPLSGGAIWHDGQMVDSERLTLAFLLSAAERGAVLANHAEAQRLLLRDGRIAGAAVRDAESGSEFDLRARTVLAVTGGSATVPFTLEDGRTLTAPRLRMALAVNVIIRRRLGGIAVGLRTRTPLERDPVCGGGRYVFLTPWRDSTLIGTAYRLWPGSPELPDPTDADLRGLLDECNEACPSLGLRGDDLVSSHRGLVPLKDGSERGRPDAVAERTRVLDHERADSVAGLVSLSGVKYTTARAGARRAVDLICAKLGRPGLACRTATTPIYGGEAMSARPADALEARLAGLHGARASALARRLVLEPRGTEPVAAGSALLRGEVGHAIREEMASSLADVIRRTGIGAESCPPRAVLEAAAACAADELGWTESRRAREIDAVIDSYRTLAPREMRP